MIYYFVNDKWVQGIKALIEIEVFIEAFLIIADSIIFLSWQSLHFIIILVLSKSITLFLSLTWQNTALDSCSDLTEYYVV